MTWQLLATRLLAWEIRYQSFGIMCKHAARASSVLFFFFCSSRSISSRFFCSVDAWHIRLVSSVRTSHHVTPRASYAASHHIVSHDMIWFEKRGGGAESSSKKLSACPGQHEAVRNKESSAKADSLEHSDVHIVHLIAPPIAPCRVFSILLQVPSQPPLWFYVETRAMHHLGEI